MSAIASPEPAAASGFAPPFTRAARRTALEIAVVSVVLAVLAVVCGVAGATTVGTSEAWAVAAAAVAWAVGAVLLALRGRLGWLPALVSMIAAAGGAALLLTDDAATHDGAAVGRAIAMAAVGGGSFHLAVALPDGTVRGRRWLAVAAGYLVAGTAAVWFERDAPVISRAPLLLGSLTLAAGVVLAVIGRRRTAGTSDRARLLWSWWGSIVTATITVLAVAMSELTGWPEHIGVVALAASTALPAALVLSSFDQLLRFAPRVLVHTMTVGGMVLLATAVYVLAIVGFEGRPNDGQRAMVALSMVATAVIAVFALPAHRRLEVLANQQVYGEREAPDAALHTFATRMSRAVPMDELLLQLAETLRKTMRLRRAEIWAGSAGAFDLAVAVPDRTAPRLTLGSDECSVAARTPVSGGSWLAVWVPDLLEGREAATIRVATVAHLGELLGFIVAERDTDSVAFDDEQDRVLTDLARQLGLALHNVRLDTALQASLDELQLRNTELVASRARIVAASDESRRQIERNLHDGAQQYLVAMAVKLGLARQLFEADPATSSELLEELRGDVQATLGELRELAHGIYPPLLRSQGLPDALTAAANRATRPTTVNASEVPRFDADIEAAVYFCCLEAIQNAGKHAGDGSHVTVTVAHRDGELSFEVADDGAGFDVESVRNGHGFVNMTDRLGAIGGTLAVTSTPGEGTCISGNVPAPAVSASR